MTSLRQVMATIAAGAGLWACTALSGVDDLEATEDSISEGKDAGVSSSSSSSGGALTDASSSTSSASSSSSSSASSSSSSTSGSPDASSTSTTSSSTSGATSSGSTTSSTSSSSSTSSTSSSSSSGGTTPTTFTDNFDRANSTTVGNNWSEKTDHFSISENKLLHVKGGDDGYFNIVAWTPLAATDVQVSYDVIYPTDSTFDADPTVVVRAPPSTVTDYNTYDGYTFYVYRDAAGIEREDTGVGTATELDYKDIAPPLTPGVTYHMTFKVTGTNPVTLTATVQDSQGTTLVTLTGTDASQKAYTASGRVGIGSATAGVGLKWDNFSETQLKP